MSSCLTCPSYLTDETVIRNRFGRYLDAPVCGRYGHLLGNPMQDQGARDAVAAFYGSACDAFGQPLPDEAALDDITKSSSSQVAIPDEEVIGRVTNGVTPHEEVATCNGCDHLMKEDESIANFGWLGSLCKARGEAIYRPALACRGCEWSVPGLPTENPGTLVLLERYKPDFRVSNEVAAKAFVGVMDSDVDPATYKTDKPVTAADKKKGIRAWRMVEDPKGMFPSVPMPIYKRDSWDEEFMHLIPDTGDQEHPELYVDYAGLTYDFVVTNVILGQTPALVGPPGVGKSEGCRHLAWWMQAPFTRIAITPTTDPADLAGSIQFDPEQGTHFVMGRLPKPWINGGLILVDEPNSGPDEVSFFLRPMFDNAAQLALDNMPGSPVFKKNPRTHCILAFNPAWDPKNIGTRDMAAADSNRLSAIQVGLPPESVERMIIKRWCNSGGFDITDAQLNTLLRIAEDIRAVDEFPDFWGLRQQIKVASYLPYFDLQRAYALAALNLYEPAIRETIERIISTYEE